MGNPISGDVAHEKQQDDQVVPLEGRKLFTIGYEGLDFEEYLRRLEENGILMVVDVRRDPVSRKPGFSKRGMAERLGAAGIRYEHLPMLGIEKERRQIIRTAEDRERVFQWYLKDVLEQEENTLSGLLKLLDTYRRVVLTCYERNPLECHRSVIAEKLVELSTEGIRVRTPPGGTKRNWVTGGPI